MENVHPLQFLDFCQEKKSHETNFYPHSEISQFALKQKFSLSAYLFVLHEFVDQRIIAAGLPEVKLVTIHDQCFQGFGADCPHHHFFDVLVLVHLKQTHHQNQDFVP